MRLIKKLILTLLVCILSTILALSFFSYTLNPETLRTYINMQLSNYMGHSSQINGDISWQIFPKPGIKATKISILDNKDHDVCLLSIDSLGLNLNIMPLLGGKLVFSELSVDGLMMQINADTIPLIKPKKNISLLKENKTIRLAKNTNFAIERLSIRHGNIRVIWNNHHVLFKELRLDAIKIKSTTSLITLKIKTYIEDSNAQQPVANARLQFRGHINLGRYFFDNFKTSPNNITINGQVILQDINVHNFKITNIHATTQFKNNLLTLNPLAMTLYDGESVGSLQYETMTKHLTIDQTASNVNSAHLLEALIHKKLIEGNLDFSFHTNFYLYQTVWQHTITGNGNISIKDGLINLVNFTKIIELTINKIGTLLTDKKRDITHIFSDWPLGVSNFFQGNTPFKLMTTQYHLNKDILYTDSFFLQTDTLQLKGQGMLSLDNYTLATQLLAKIITKNDQLTHIQTVLGGTIPLLIQGSLIKPIVMPDINKINPILMKIWLKETLTKPVEKLKNTLIYYKTNWR